MKFLIKSEKLEKLAPLFDQVLEIIKKAIYEKRQIIIKHHDDVDGYASGYVLEKAISMLIDDKRGYQLFRSASRTPYYEYIDALRDLNNFIGFHPPLIILADLGSNDQSIKSIKRLKTYGADFIIIDHHKYDELNKESVKVFLNPHVFGLGSDLSAGILATEIALNLNPKINLDHIPALSGVADKSEGKEIEEYLKISGMDMETMQEWGMLLDHELYYVKFGLRQNMLDDLFTNKKNIDFLKEQLENDFLKLKESAKKYMLKKDFGKFLLLRLDRDLIGDYEYPSSKLPRIVHELETGPRITLIESESSISYRADQVDFDGVKMIDEMKKRFPYALVSGGGHASAGGIRFNAASKDEIIKFIEEYLC
jgi:RecJ-like exonuclease